MGSDAASRVLEDLLDTVGKVLSEVPTTHKSCLVAYLGANGR